MGVHPAEEDQSASHKKYTVFLVLFNAALFFLGIGTIYLGVEGVDMEFEELTEDMIGASFFTIAIAAGAFLIGVAITGFLATKWTEVGKCSKMMWAYGLLIAICFAMVTAVFFGSIFTFMYLNSQTLDGYDPESTFDSTILSALQAYPDSWILAQDYYECCGWATEDALRTGSQCAHGDAQDCRSLMIVEYLDEIQIITLVSLVVFIMVGMVLLSISCLCCMQSYGGVEDEEIEKKAKRYQLFLNCFNLLLAIMGCGVLYLATGGDVTDFDALQDEFLGASFFTLAVCSAVFLLLVSFFGCFAAYSGRNSLKTHTCSKTLWAYAFIVFVITILVLAVFGGSIYTYNLLNDEASAGYNSTNPSAFDTGVILVIEDYPVPWEDLQDYFECCGYAGVQYNYTGHYCNPDSATGLIGPDCRALLVGEYIDELYIFSIVSLVGFIIIFMAFMAVVSLGCLSKLEGYGEAAQDDPEPQDYQ